MIKIENTEVTGWEAAIRGMRNPFNSWELSDSLFFTSDGDAHDICGNIAPSYEMSDGTFEIGMSDHELMMSLTKGGSSDHAKYRRMITVYTDILAPLYWWKEFDTYKVGTVANSCSTMHKIHAKDFTMDDFSHEYLEDFENCEELSCNPSDIWFYNTLSLIVHRLNAARELYLQTKDKKYWWQMIQLLPSSYNQRRTVMMNYEVLANIYASRKYHKLDEWREFCEWVEKLSYSEIIVGETEYK